jgi:hypothetical protein
MCHYCSCKNEISFLFIIPCAVNFPSGILYTVCIAWRRSDWLKNVNYVTFLTPKTNCCCDWWSVSVYFSVWFICRDLCHTYTSVWYIWTKLQVTCCLAQLFPALLTLCLISLKSTTQCRCLHLFCVPVCFESMPQIECFLSWRGSLVPGMVWTEL